MKGEAENPKLYQKTRYPKLLNFKRKKIMKKKMSLLVFALAALMASAQVSQTVDVSTPGTLHTLASAYLNTVTNLTITGSIDASDIKTMRDEMPLLAILNLSGTSINAYSGAGTDPSSTTYKANEMPAFSFCDPNTGKGKTSLTTITLPNSLTSIGNYAFIFCYGITGALILPDGITNIGDAAFLSCSGITNLTFPTNLNSIGLGTFSKCTGIAGNVTFPNSLVSVGLSAFEKCSKITSFTFPISLTTIGKYAFSDCFALIEFIIPVENQSFSTIDGTLFNKDQTTLIQYPAGKKGNYILPNTVIHIGEYAFCGCSGITSLSISSSLTTIGSSAFSVCPSLTEFIVPETNQLYSSLNGVLFNKNQTILIQYPAGRQGSYNIPNSVTTIENLAFIDCSGISELIIPEANQFFSSLNGVLFNKNQTRLIQYPAGKQGTYIVPNTVKTIGNYSFLNCLGITGLNFPTSLTAIESSAFTGCSSITTLTFPAGLTSIGDFSFSDCISLKTIYCLNPASPTTGNYCFNGVTSITDVYVPTDIAVASYKANTAWYSKFPGDIIKRNITNGVLESINTDVKVYTTSSKIIIEGTKQGEIVTLFTINGKQIQTVKSEGERIIIAAQHEAVYLVKTVSRTFKVIL